MDILGIIAQLPVFVAGILMLVFNRKIGKFAEKNLSFGPEILKAIWFPRINAIVIGIILTVGSLGNLYYYIFGEK